MNHRDMTIQFHNITEVKIVEAIEFGGTKGNYVDLQITCADYLDEIIEQEITLFFKEPGAAEAFVKSFNQSTPRCKVEKGYNARRYSNLLSRIRRERHCPVS